MSGVSASDTVVLFLPEVFDSQLVAPDRSEPTWPHALLRNQSPRYRVQQILAEILGAKKLRAGPVIESFGVPQPYGRMRARALQAGFSSDQIVAWGYDWRRAPVDIVQDLLALPAPPGDGPIAILGHGYGGLVAKALMQAGPAWRDRVEAILYLGTPHQGCDIERLAPIICPFGWLSPTALRIMSDPGLPVPLQSLAVMTRPWLYEVPLQCPGVREIDVFARCFGTPMLWPDVDRILYHAGDGLHLAMCVRTASNEPLETDRFHADLPSCPKLWWYLARHILGRRPALETPWASGAIHVQRSQIGAEMCLAGLRFRGEASVEVWIEAQAMIGKGRRFEPSQDPARMSEICLVNGQMSPTSRVGNYAAVSLTEFRKFVRLSLWAASSWDEATGAPSLLDERLVYVTDPRTLDQAGFNGWFRTVLGPAGHWLGQRPIASRGQPANVLRAW